MRIKVLYIRATDVVDILPISVLRSNVTMSVAYLSVKISKMFKTKVRIKDVNPDMNYFAVFTLIIKLRK